MRTYWTATAAWVERSTGEDGKERDGAGVYDVAAHLHGEGYPSEGRGRGKTGLEVKILPSAVRSVECGER